MSADILTRLDFRLAQEEPAFDLESDLFVAACSDGSAVYAPTEAEANAERNRYERRLRFRIFAACEPGSPEQAAALEAMRTAGQLRPWADAEREHAAEASAEATLGGQP